VNPTISKKIAVIGAGQMAEALLGGVLAAHMVDPADVCATDISPERRDLMKRRFGIRVEAANHAVVSFAEVVILAVKPQSLDSVLDDLAPNVSGKLLVSIVAGASIARIAGRVAAGARIVRVMPNAPALVREGISALAFGPDLNEEDRATARTLFEAVGRVVVVEEHLMSAVTGLSGSGPAYMFMAIEALADGGVKMGLPRSVAELLAAQTVLGAARMILETGEHPGRLKDRVASPGGTTIEGLHQLEIGGMRAALIEAVEAAAKRADELGR
jgi:pyrroline-5-carboxylate reductase